MRAQQTGTAPVAVTMYHADSAVRIAFWRNVAIVVVRGDADVACMRLLERGYRRLVADYPDGIAVLAVICPGTPVANEVARNECVRFIRELDRQLLVIATVIEDTGVMGSVLRSVVRGLNLVVRNRNLTAFAGVSYAADAIARRLFLGEDVRRARWEIVQAVHAARGDEERGFTAGPPSPPASGIRPVLTRTPRRLG